MLNYIMVRREELLLLGNIYLQLADLVVKAGLWIILGVVPILMVEKALVGIIIIVGLAEMAIRRVEVLLT